MTKHLSYLLCLSGVLVVMHIVSDLVAYSDASKKYIQQTMPCVEAFVYGKTTAKDEKYRAQLQKIFAEKLTSEEFGQNIDVINRALQPNPAPMQSEDRLTLAINLGSLSAKMNLHQVPDRPGMFLLLGCVLFYLGSLLQPKPKPAPPPAPPDKRPWDDVPPITLPAQSVQKDTTNLI